MSDELLGHFVAEGRDLMQAASDDLLALEQAPDDAARIDNAFRALHTMKGSVGLFDLAPLGGVLHAAEDLLGAFRDRQKRPDRGALDALLECVGAIEGWFDDISDTGRLPPGAEARCNRLAGAIRAHLAGPAEALPQAAEDPPPPWLAALLARDPAAVAAGERLVALRYVPDPDCYFRGDDPLAVLRAVPDLRIVRAGLHDPGLAAASPFTCTLILECVSAAPEQAVRNAVRFVADQCSIVTVPVPAEALPPADTDAPRAGRRFRIDAERVDALADLAAELIIAKNRLAHLVAGAALPPAAQRAFAASQADIERLSADLQRGVMRLRMVRLEQAFRRLPRVVRETAARLGKSVQLQIEGGDTEADRSVVDALHDPLLHIMRNAIDHGIEEEAVRRRAGKPASGRITVAARRDSHEIAIDIADDGQGIDPARVRRKAIEKGLLTEAQAVPEGDAGLLELIFAPGFSTAGSITETSGRGVGLDVVRGIIEALGGRVSVTSAQGQGTVVHIALPLVASVTSIVIVRSDGDMFGVPFEDVVETARLPRGAIRPLAGGAAFVLRERTVPLVQLSALLGAPAADRPAADAKVLVIRAGGELVGVEVDGFAERMDVILRPMAGLLAGMRGAMGTALLGDGRLLIVLRLPDLVADQLSGQVPER